MPDDRVTVFEGTAVPMREREGGTGENGAREAEQRLAVTREARPPGMGG
jgi:hypothetical protein